MFLKQISLAAQVVYPTCNQLGRHVHRSSQQSGDVDPLARGEETSDMVAWAAEAVVGEM